MAATGGHYLQPEEVTAGLVRNSERTAGRGQEFYDTINEIRMIVPLTKDHRGSSQNGFTNAVTHYWQYYLDQPSTRNRIAQTWRYVLEYCFIGWIILTKS